VMRARNHAVRSGCSDLPACRVPALREKVVPAGLLSFDGRRTIQTAACACPQASARTFYAAPPRHGRGMTWDTVSAAYAWGGRDDVLCLRSRQFWRLTIVRRSVR